MQWRIRPQFKDKDHRAFFHLGEEMGAENRVENLGEEGYRSLGKKFQNSVRDTFKARSIDVKTSDGFMNLVRVC